MRTIIPSGGFDIVSFNDDTSPDARLTSDQKVVVNGQVMPESSLEWYYQILKLCSSVQGEVKSSDVWSRIQGLRGESRELIGRGLSKVRVHIVDPRPYRGRLNESLKERFYSDDPLALIRQQASLDNPSAKSFARQIRIFTAERILDDSIAARVHRVSQFVHDIDQLIDEGFAPRPDDVVPLHEFGLDERGLVITVSGWAAKSAAAFHEALDEYLELDEDERLSPGLRVRMRMHSRVLEMHAFDEGHKNQIKLLLDAREAIFQKLRDPRLSKPPAGPYPELNSQDSFLVQAADIAAGIASKIIETQNLAAVVSAFEYVTYNGRRVSISDMEEELRLIG